jgi:H+-transporting ATPase
MNSKADQPKAPESKPDAKDDLETLPLPEVEKKLESSPEGLTQAEAQKRLTQYGPNELTEKKTNLFLKFLSYFWGPILWMIEGEVILSAQLLHWPGVFIIHTCTTKTQVTRVSMATFFLLRRSWRMRE